MRAVGFRQSLPVDHPESLLDIELPDPVASGHDLLVDVHAVSVNPIDTKVRRNMPPPAGEFKVPGFDAAGVVRAVGESVTLFKPGDRVWYAGSIMRPGTNSERHLVDERIVGRMPASLDFAAAAAMPLTAVTAWEVLFDRLQIPQGAGSGKVLLIIGAGGGVGSIMVQLARQLTALTVIGTANRPETRDWVSLMGAHAVIDHARPLTEELQRVGCPEVHYVVSLTQTHRYLSQIVDALVPQGRMALIDDPEQMDIGLLKRKSLSLHWESMFTRSMYQTSDMIEQHHILNHVAEMVDSGRIRTTLVEQWGTINAANLRRAHALIESGKSRGKIVLSGF